MRWLALAVALFVGCNGCDDLDEPVNANCGNGSVDGREICDGEALGGESCASQGFSSGDLGCSPTCGGFVFARCEGIRNASSSCDFCEPWERCVDATCKSVCEGEPFTEDTELELHVTTVRLTGSVTVGDEPPGVRSSIVLKGEVWWEPLLIELADDGTFQTHLEPGTYEVVWQGPPDFGSERLADLEIITDSDVVLPLTPWKRLEAKVHLMNAVPSSTAFGEDLGNLIFEHLDPRFGRTQVGFNSSGEHNPWFLRDGEYRVWWKHNVDDFVTTEYLEEASAENLRTRDFINIPVQLANIMITMNGTPIRNDGSVAVDLVRSDEVPRPGWNVSNRDRETWTLDETGRASGWLLDRPRDVALVVNGPPWWGWVWVARNQTLAMRELDLDISAPLVAGEVRRNGTRLPNSRLEGVTRGRLEFSSQDDGFITVELADRGRAEFEVELPRGLWNLRIVGNIWSAALPIVPYEHPNAISVEANVADLEIDVPAVRLAGALTVNSLRPDDEPDLEVRGSLQLRHAGGNTWFAVPIPPRGPAGWDVLLAPGKYDAGLARYWFATSGEDPPPGVLPFGRWPLETIDVTASTRSDVDVRIVEVTARITEHGEPSRPGLLKFEALQSGLRARESRTVQGRAAVTLYPGLYRTLWAPLNEDGKAGEAVVLERTLRVEGATELEYDVGFVQISGEVWVNDELARDASDGVLHLARQPRSTAYDVSLAELGPARFTTDVVNGFYNIFLDGTPDHPTLPGHGVVVHRTCEDERLD